MSVDDQPLCPTEPVDVTAAAQGLLSGLLAEPWGQVSPSVYETGRLVTLAPWLKGHSERLRSCCTHWRSPVRRHAARR